jgi:N,N'-diacetyllegionaminate synthase
MKLFGKDLTADVAFVAEIGVNHEGSFEAARTLVRQAAAAGADAIKLQTYTPERFASADDPERLARVRRFGLDAEALAVLARDAAENGSVLFSTAVTEDVVPLLAGLFPVIKIASGDVTFEPVIRAAAATGKPVILSTGAADADEVAAAVGWFADAVAPVPVAERLVLMQCTATYPAPVEEASVRTVPWLAERFGVTTGYSNHVIGPEACLAAIALGARVIEVHFTDRREGRTFRDHHIAFEPDEFRALAAAGRRVLGALGTPVKAVQPSEVAARWAIRKGVVAARDLPAGTVLTRDDLMFARPATAVPAGRVGAVVGRRLTAALSAGHMVRPDLLDPPL